MKFHFDLTNLKVLDAVEIERIQIDTDYSVTEFLTMIAEQPALVAALTKLILSPSPDAPASRAGIDK